MKITYLFFCAIVLFFSACSSDSTIKKDLDSRFTKFEIVEIKPDSANFEYALNVLRELSLKTSTANLEIIKGLNNIEFKEGKKTADENFHHIDSIHNDLIASFTNFENSKYSKKDAVYYVKYRIYKDELKVEKEEFYLIRTSEGKILEVLHRPYDWDEFLREKKYGDLIKEAVKYSGEIYSLKSKFKQGS